MMEGGSSGKKKRAAKRQDHDFAQLIFSWSLDDILNDNLYENQVDKLPLTFQYEEHYFRSFMYPLLEETRTELASSMKMMYKTPFSEISSFKKAKGKEKMIVWAVHVNPGFNKWRTLDSWQKVSCGNRSITLRSRNNKFMTRKFVSSSFMAEALMICNACHKRAS
ncbi:unnamed protein product [Lactuca saligna]|uniref:Uncharacterized protein n=1 Tax=Lactuca saligna TaxID=75948 RepID=A0AA36E8S9_LACSI|nr:unnamed protein product [Lactuca saligna]